MDQILPQNLGQWIALAIFVLALTATAIKAYKAGGWKAVALAIIAGIESVPSQSGTVADVKKATSDIAKGTGAEKMLAPAVQQVSLDMKAAGMKSEDDQTGPKAIGQIVQILTGKEPKQ